MNGLFIFHENKWAWSYLLQNHLYGSELRESSGCFLGSCIDEKEISYNFVDWKECERKLTELRIEIFYSRFISQSPITHKSKSPLFLFHIHSALHCIYQFTVRVVNNNGAPYTASGATALGDYVLTMNFYPRVNVNNSMI